MEDIREEKSAEDQETVLQKSQLETPSRSNNQTNIKFPTNLSESEPDEENQEQIGQLKSLSPIDDQMGEDNHFITNNTPNLSGDLLHDLQQSIAESEKQIDDYMRQNAMK